MSRRSGSDPVQLMRVSAAALVGGLLAMAVLAVVRDVQRAGLLLGFVVAAVAFSVLAVITLSPTPERSAAERRSRLDGEGPGWEFAPGSQAAQQASDRPGASTRRPGGAGDGTPVVRASAPRWSPSPSQPGPEPSPMAPVSVAVPVPGGTWWEAAASDDARVPATASSPARNQPVVPALDIADAEKTRVVQCPRCGDFGVDVLHHDPGFAFTCTHCDHHWRWGRGSAWPVAVVRPRQNGRQTPRTGSEAR